MAQRLRLWPAQRVRLELAQQALARLGLDCLVQVQQAQAQRQRLALEQRQPVVSWALVQGQPEPALQRVVFWVGRPQRPFPRLQRSAVLWRLLLRAVDWLRPGWLATWRKPNPTLKQLRRECRLQAL